MDIQVRGHHCLFELLEELLIDLAAALNEKLVDFLENVFEESALEHSVVILSRRPAKWAAANLLYPRGNAGVPEEKGNKTSRHGDNTAPNLPPSPRARRTQGREDLQADHRAGQKSGFEDHRPGFPGARRRRAQNGNKARHTKGR